MAEEYKKVAFYDEVASLSDTAPEDVTTAAASEGVATEASRRDHKHDIAVKLNELEAPDGDVALNTKKITGLGDPAAAQDGATKKYVDGVATGLDIKASCRVATAAALPTCTPAGSGVDKTLEADANGVLTVDGVEIALNDRILVKDQVAGDDNGIYKCTRAGEAEVKFELTRAIDFDEDAEVTAGAYTFIAEGTDNADEGWVLTTNDPITVDTTELVFGQFSSIGGVLAHKDTHDPEDGADPLDCAAPAELAGVQAAGEGSAHEFARADHAHQIQHSIADNHLVTIDDAGPAVSGEYAKFTADGLEGKPAADVRTDLNVADGADVTGSNAPQAHKVSHQSGGGDELDLTGMKADSIAEKTADTGVTVDTCLIKDGKAADSNKLEGDSKATVQDHAPKAHTLNSHSAPDGKVAFAGKEGGDFVLENLEANPVTPVLGKIYFKTGDTHPYVCVAV